MRKASLAEAKTHLSKLVDDAEHRGVSTLIQRHGKPAALLIPVPDKPRRKGMTPQQIAALHRSVESTDEPGVSAVRDLIEGRR